MRVGSLCTGYGGLDLALGGDLVFVSEIDRDASTVLAERFPEVPNLGDFTALDTLPEVDVLTAGFPCQPVSQAGRRQGTADERWLWDDIESLVGRMERPPPVLFLENVRGLLTANGGDAMARVIHGLARLGYVGSWRTVRASDVGACHRRERVFIRAHLADASHVGHERTGPARGRGTGPANGGGAAAHTNSHPRPQPDSRPQTGRQVLRGGHPQRSGLFGPYWPVVHQWERTVGRPAPDPTTTTTDTDISRREADPHDEGGRLHTHGMARLNPRFVEWMMGLPDGWVTNCGLTRTAQLRILGNGVVPQQAAHAWQSLGSLA